MAQYRGDLGGKIRKERLIVIGVRRRDEAAANLLVVDDQALLTKGGPKTTPAVMFELITDGDHRLDDSVSSAENVPVPRVFLDLGPRTPDYLPIGLAFANAFCPPVHASKHWAQRGSDLTLPP